MKSRLPVLILIATLLLVGGSAAVGCGGDGSLSLEDYFQRLQELRSDGRERSDELEKTYNERIDAAATDEEWLKATRESFAQLASLFSDFVDRLDGMSPPAEAKDAHGDFVKASSDVRGLLDGLVDDLNTARSRSEADGRLGEFAARNDASARVDDACVALQRVADEHDIGVDLECEGSDQAPVDDGTPSAPEATETAGPTPAAAAPDIQVLNYRPYQSEFGTLQFFGEVINNGDRAAANVRVVLTLTDDAGDVVGTGSAFVKGPAIVEPGATAPFNIFVSEPPEGWANETLQISSEEPGSFIFGNTYTDLELSGVTAVPAEFGGLTVRGQVTNIGSESAGLVEVVFVARDTDGTVMWVDFTFIDIDPLRPGVAAPFEIRAFDFDEVPSAFDVIAVGSPQ